MFKLYIVIAFTTLVVVTYGCPDITTKQQWGGVQPTKITKLPHKPGYVIIHHTATKTCEGTACYPILKSIQAFHMQKGWDDIGYNFLVGNAGDIYEGRGWGVVGAHAPNYNSRSVGIAVLGNFTGQKPSSSALAAIKSLIECGVNRKSITEDYELLGHRQTKPTECPGNELYGIITTWPHWTSKP